MISRLLVSISRFGDWCFYSGAVLAAISLFVMMSLITVDVVLREFGHSTGIAVEISQYLLAGIFFLGFGYTLRQGKHIRIRVVTDKIHDRARNWFYLGNSIVALGLAIWFVWYTRLYVIDAFNMRSVSMTLLRTPLWIVQSTMPIGFTLFTIAVVIEVVKTMKLILRKK